MSSRSQDKLFTFLTTLLADAGKAITALISSELQIKHKKDRSLVTEADMASESIIVQHIKSAFANDYIYSEESGCHPAASMMTFPLTLDDDEQDELPEPDWQFATRKEGDHVWSSTRWTARLTLPTTILFTVFRWHWVKCVPMGIS